MTDETKPKATRKTGDRKASTKTPRKPAAAKKTSAEISATKPETKATDETKQTTETKSNATEAEDKGKAVAEENAKEQEETLRPADGEDVPELRDRRAYLLEELRQIDAAAVEARQKEAKTAGLHEAKLDDEGAAAQQRAAREGNVDLLNELAELEGPPVVAPVLEESEASFKIVSRREGEEFEKGLDYVETDSARFVGFNLHIIAENLPYPGEVIIDIRRENGQDHQRFSAWTEDGNLDTVLPGINGTGDWVVHLESLVTQVGEGRDDRLPLIKETAERKLELY